MMCDLILLLQFLWHICAPMKKMSFTPFAGPKRPLYCPVVCEGANGHVLSVGRFHLVIVTRL